MKSVHTIYLWWCVLSISVLVLGCQGRKEWTRVQEWDDIQSYEWFIEQHPNSKYAEKADLRLAELYWQETLARDKIRQIQPQKVGFEKGSPRQFHNAIRAYNAYLGRFLDSKHTKEALGRLDTLYWEEARLFDRISHYQKFVNEHPRSPFAEEGIKRLQFLKEHAAIFTDPVLEKAVRRGINKNQGKDYGEILKADLKGMQRLDLWLEPQLERLDGIGHLNDLTYLRLPYDSQVSDWTPLKGLLNLEELIVANNRLQDLAVLSGLQKLKKLDLENNHIVKIQPLSQLKALQVLNLARNQIRFIEPLIDMHDLKILILYKNEIVDIAPLEGLKSLEEVWLGNNNIESIMSLKGLKEMRLLRLEDNKIKDISTIHMSEKLVTINLANNRIERIEGLVGLKDILELNLSGNKIADLKIFNKIKKIDRLILSYNLIYDIEPLRNIEVKEMLLLNNNKITKLKPLFLNTSLQINQVRVELKNNPLVSTTADRLVKGQTTGKYIRWQW